MSGVPRALQHRGAIRSAVLIVIAALIGGACTSRGATTATTFSATTSAPPPTTTTTTVDEIGIVAPVVRSPVTGEIFYFLLTDRFANGDPDNDAGGESADTSDAAVLRHGFLPTHTGYYHGGDIAGLVASLDYLAGLGVTSLWLTPPLVNRVVQGNGTVGGSSAGYHGYWQVDYTSVDPHLGSVADMQALVAEAHARGMKVFFDIVLNHTGDVITYADGSFAYINKDTAPYLDANGVAFDDAEWAGGADFPDLDSGVSFPHVPEFASDADATLKVPDWLNDPIYYHNRGNSSFTGENSLYGDFFGLDDLFTEHPFVVEGLIDIHKQLIDTYDIDGFRVDTVKHVNDEFWEAFVAAITDHAAAAGKDGFFMFGEVFGESPSFRSVYTTALEFPAVLDFGFNDAALAFVADGASSKVLADHFSSDDWYTDADSNASMLVKFIGNHDIGRLGHFVSLGTRGDDAERLRRVQLAYELMFFSRGIPLVYYGDEQGFVGDGEDQKARQDMFPSQVDSYNDDDLIGTDGTTADDNFDPTHPIYVHIGDLARLRSEHPALVNGAHITLFSATEPGIYAFSRIDRDEPIEYVVAVNNSPTTKAATFSVATPGTSFSKVYPVPDDEVRATGDGRLGLIVPGLSAVVYRADQPLAPTPSAPGVRVSFPEAGSEVAFERFRIEAKLDRDAFVEVTFAVSVDGDEFRVLGTDDAPPYRVYWDSGAYPDGATVEVMATVDDLAGHRSVGATEFTLGARRG